MNLMLNEEVVTFTGLVSEFGAFAFLENSDILSISDCKRLSVIMESHVISQEIINVLHRQDDLILVDEQEDMIYVLGFEYLTAKIILKEQVLREFFKGEENFPLKLIVPSFLH
jgi:hypothetical protein